MLQVPGVETISRDEILAKIGLVADEENVPRPDWGLQLRQLLKVSVAVDVGAAGRWFCGVS